MSAYAWPAVALCFLALLWRGLDLMIVALRARTNNHALSIRDHEKTIGSLVQRASGLEASVTILQADVAFLKNARVPR